MANGRNRKVPPRKQKVALRAKVRGERKLLFRRLIAAGLVSLVLGTAGWWALGQGNIRQSAAELFAVPHVRCAGTLGVSAEKALAAAGSPSWVWWLPGSGWWLRAKLTRRYAALEETRLERQWSQKTIVMHLTDREPLALWKTGSGLCGMDGQSVIFPLDPAHPAAGKLPTVTARRVNRALGRWLGTLAERKNSWCGKVRELILDDAGRLTIVLAEGRRMEWGSLMDSPVAKFALLEQVLEDAKGRFGGVQNINLMMWREGRIVIRPIRFSGNAIKGERHG